MEKEKIKHKSNLSWGQLIILFGTIVCFIFALTQRVKIENLKALEVTGYKFSGGTITSYSGNDEVLEIPMSYSFGSTKNISGTVTFNSRSQARNFLQENYAVGAEGYYDFYNEMYSQSYPWTYTYSINQYTYVKGTDIKVNNIARDAFSGNTKIKKVILPYTIENIELFAFQNCSNLANIEFSEGLTKIGDSSFWGIAIEKLVLPNSVKRIDPYAFFTCTQLKEAIISKSMEDMQTGTFNGCSNLVKVTILSENDISAWDTGYYQTFSRCNSALKIYVPNSKLNYYKTTSPWDIYKEQYIGF